MHKTRGPSDRTHMHKTLGPSDRMNNAIPTAVLHNERQPSSHLCQPSVLRIQLRPVPQQAIRQTVVNVLSWLPWIRESPAMHTS